MTAQLFSKRKIVRAVKENMTRMCSINWKCISPQDRAMCVRGREADVEEEKHRARSWQGETGPRAPQLGLNQRAVKGPFLIDKNAGTHSPPQLPHSLLIQWLRRAFFDEALKLVALRLLFLCDLDHQP